MEKCIFYACSHKEDLVVVPKHVSDHLKNSKIKLNKGTTHICSRHFDSNQLKVDRRGKKKVNDEAYPHLYLPGTEDDIEHEEIQPAIAKRRLSGQEQTPLGKKPKTKSSYEEFWSSVRILEQDEMIKSTNFYCHGKKTCQFIIENFQGYEKKCEITSEFWIIIQFPNSRRLRVKCNHDVLTVEKIHRLLQLINQYENVRDLIPKFFQHSDEVSDMRRNILEMFYDVEQPQKSQSLLTINAEQLKEVAEECERKTRDTEGRLIDSFNNISILSNVHEDEEPVNDYSPLNQEKQNKIKNWICGRDVGTGLISKFNLQVTRHDIQTLHWNPLTQLNDKVINFYMELLAERSRKNEKLLKIHRMNTFFLKRLMETGYSGVRRWTRTVDIFEHDIIPIPVHEGIHWCMAIIHLKNKTIKYYDSMGAPNNPVLSALADYLKSESLDKKKVEFDMSGWTVENVKNIPQQENGSDCGVFSCMYAEFVTRNRPIVFTQSHMTYFRMKMVYEICTGQMLN